MRVFVCLDGSLHVLCRRPSLPIAMQVCQCTRKYAQGTLDPCFPEVDLRMACWIATQINAFGGEQRRQPHRCLADLLSTKAFLTSAQQWLRGWPAVACPHRTSM